MTPPCDAPGDAALEAKSRPAAEEAREPPILLEKTPLKMVH
jgi:hypothetical protein